MCVSGDECECVVLHCVCVVMSVSGDECECVVDHVLEHWCNVWVEHSTH